MANINITNLPVAISLTGNEKLMITSGATSYSATTGQIAGLATNVGTVTSIATASPITGGTITTTGTALSVEGNMRMLNKYCNSR